MSFVHAHQEWINQHEMKRHGERLRRLTEGHGHAERMFLEHVWWPAFGDFEHLHPEYEIQDFRDGSRFLDFAYLRGHLRLAVEIDGYGPHHQKMSRNQFSDQWIRQNHLIIDGWKVLRFSYDDVHTRPRMCVQLLQQFMGKWVSRGPEKIGLISAEEKEIIRMAIRLNRSFIPQEVCILLNVKQEKARKLLRNLVDKNFLIPEGHGVERIRSYKLAAEMNLDAIQM